MALIISLVFFFSFCQLFLMQQYFIFAVENNASVVITKFAIIKMYLNGTNFQT